MPVCRNPIGRIARDDGLAVELEHQPQHAVRAGVLRPHVDGHRFGAEFSCHSSASSLHQLAHHVQITCGALPARAPCTSSGTFTCTSARRPALAAVAARSARSSAARRRAPPQRRDHVRRRAARRDRHRDIPGRPSASTCRANTRVEPVVVGDAREHRWCPPSARSPPSPRRSMLRTARPAPSTKCWASRRAAAVAEHQHLPARPRAHRRWSPAAVGHRRRDPGRAPGGAASIAASSVRRHGRDRRVDTRSRRHQLLRVRSGSCGRAPRGLACWPRTPPPITCSGSTITALSCESAPGSPCAADNPPSRRASGSRRRSGWPSKCMPNRSKTSRSRPVRRRPDARRPSAHASPSGTRTFRRSGASARVAVAGYARGTRGCRRSRSAGRAADSRRR